MDTKFFAFAAVLALLLAGCTGEEKPNAAYATITFPNNFSVNAEIASTPSSRETGLMHRQSLCESCGMLFVFESPQKYSFWMKNTKIPLDMIFISENGTVADIIQNVPPCPQNVSQCPDYVPRAPALFVLEVNAGTAEREGLQPGSRLTITL